MYNPARNLPAPLVPQFNWIELMFHYCLIEAFAQLDEQPKDIIFYGISSQ